MIYIAHELLAKLRLLTLTGQDGNGELEWVGNKKQWSQLEGESEIIQRAYKLSTKF